MFAEDEAALLRGSSLEGDELEDLVRRRIGGEPLETVLGWVAFAGRRVIVRPGVFVPRRRTELLARLAASHSGPESVFLELCCGVGPIATTVVATEIHLADLDRAALACAAQNVPRGHIHHSDLYADLPGDLRGRIDVVAANAPYVPTAQLALMPPEAREHEQPMALDGGPDGVHLHRRIAAEAPDWLAPAGVLMIETSPSQVSLTEQAMHDAGLVSEVVTDDDISGCVVLGVRPGERA